MPLPHRHKHLDIIQAILAGNEPSGISLEKLTKNLPLDWNEQRQRLGVPL